MALFFYCTYCALHTLTQQLRLNFLTLVTRLERHHCSSLSQILGLCCFTFLLISSVSFVFVGDYMLHVLTDNHSVRYHDDGSKELNACILLLSHMVYL